MIRDNHLIMNLDSMWRDLNRYLVDQYFIIYPMVLCHFPKEVMNVLKENRFLEKDDIPIEDVNIFDYIWFATKLLRYAFTNNIHVYTCKGYLNNSLWVISADKKISEQFLETCEKLKLCGVTNLVNSAKPLVRNEITFRNFRCIFNNSMSQWLLGNGDVDDELMTAWCYENDWLVNDAQRNILQTLVYSKYEVLEIANFSSKY